MGVKNSCWIEQKTCLNPWWIYQATRPTDTRGAQQQHKRGPKWSPNDCKKDNVGFEKTVSYDIEWNKISITVWIHLTWQDLIYNDVFNHLTICWQIPDIRKWKIDWNIQFKTTRKKRYFGMHKERFRTVFWWKCHASKNGSERFPQTFPQETVQNGSELFGFFGRFYKERFRTVSWHISWGRVFVHVLSISRLLSWKFGRKNFQTLLLR